MKKLFSFILGLQVLMLIAIPALSSAQVNPTGSKTYVIQIPSPLSSDIDSIPKLIIVVIDKIVIPVGAVIAVLMIMYAGFLFVTAQGNKTRVDEAKSALLNASIGTAILLGAKLLATAVQSTINQLQ